MGNFKTLKSRFKSCPASWHPEPLALNVIIMKLTVHRLWIHERKGPIATIWLTSALQHLNWINAFGLSYFGTSHLLVALGVLRVVALFQTETIQMIDHVLDIILAHAAGTACMPEEAILVLNVLAKGRAPSILSAVLSCGFSDFDPSLIVKHDHGLALLPHYPSYILFDDLQNTLAATSARGDLAILDLLWQLVGPTTPSRMAFFEESCLLNSAIMHGHIGVLEWLSRAADTAGISIKWASRPWYLAAEAGCSKLFHWAIAHGYVKELGSAAALLSARYGNISIMEWWISQQPSNEAVVEALNNVNVLTYASRQGAIAALEWWWVYTGSKLPKPRTMANIATAALTGTHMAVVEWWWTRFLEHRMSEHKFGMRLLEIEQFSSVQVLDWFHRHHHLSPECFLPVSNPGGEVLNFTIKSPTTLPILQWALEKCTELGGQKLVVMSPVTSRCAYVGDLETLDFLLRSSDALVVTWACDLVLMAVRGGHLKVLEWWDRNKGMLPPQVLDCPLDFSGRIASKDAVDLLAWWNDRFPISDDEWQRICLFAIEKNALRVQSWLRGHRDLFTLDTDNLHLHLMEEHSFTLRHPRPFTLDFLNSVYPDLVMDPTLPLPESFYLSWTLMLWLCARANVTVASLLPLQPIALMMLLIHHDVLTLERWLQAYITAGHPFVLPDADKVYDHERAWMEVDDTRPICQRQDSLHRWMYDVTVTRKIAVFETTGSGTFVLYMSPPFSFSS